MDHPEPNKSQIRGKDLAGAIKVMPMGLDAAIKKRVSGEFKSEQRGGAVSFSSAETTSTSMKSSMKTSMESRTMQSFQEEVPEPKIGTPFQQAGFKSAPSQDQQTTSFIQNSSMKQQQSNSSSFGQSSCQQMSSSMSTSQKSMMTSSSSSTKSVSMQSSSITQKDFGEAGSQMSFQQEPEEALEVHQEIGQDNLKTQLVSCISDLEKDRDFVDFNKENAPLSLSSPPPTFSPGPGTTQKQEATPPHKQDMFSPPPLEPMEPPKPQAEPMKPLATQPQPLAQPMAQPIRNGVQNGFSDFLGSSSQTVEMCQASSYQQSTQQVMNGSFEETGSVQGSSSSSSLLQKIMTPANPEYDTGSLKRRDPRKMFTDSSFYSAKHHPTVADQVEMAHKLSSAMFNDKNKSTKGQQMFLSRVQNAGDEEAEQDMDPNKMPNLKHVMNPEGRMLEWGDVTQEELPNVDLMATHAAPNLNTPDPIAESLNAEAGKGETELSRPSTFVSAYRRVFEQNRGFFGSPESTTGTCDSPRLKHKTVETHNIGPTALNPVRSPQVANKNCQGVRTPNLNKNRPTTHKCVTIIDNKAKDIKGEGVKVCEDKGLVEMKPVTVKIKDAADTQPIAPPRKTHFKDSPATSRATAPHLVENRKELDNQTSVGGAGLPALDNRKPAENQSPVFFKPLDNRAPVRRHASFNEKNGLDNRRTRGSIWENNSNLCVSSRPSDVLRTPYLLSSSNRALHHQSSQCVGNFPHIQSTSMVAKTKALFEIPSENNNNRNFVPLTKSRTFSSFPTSTDSALYPQSPSVPQRNSSRQVIHSFKSINGNINDCDCEASSSPQTQRRIPMASFF